MAATEHGHTATVLTTENASYCGLGSPRGRPPVGGAEAGARIAGQLQVCRLASLWSIKGDPDYEVRRERFKAVDPPGRNKDKRPDANRLVTLTVEEQAGALHDKIDFVSRVRLLRVMPCWRIDFNDQRAVREDRNGQIARWRWSFRERLGQSDDGGPDAWFHRNILSSTGPMRQAQNG